MIAVSAVEPVGGGPGPRDPAVPGDWLPLPVRHRLGGRQTRTGLSADATERDALCDQLGQCSDMPITVTLAR